jgi:hypothetical protein
VKTGKRKTPADLTPAELNAVRQVRDRRPYWRYLIGCERCATICVDGYLCKCCQAYKTKSRGGTTVYYPDDGAGHYHIGAVADILKAGAA